MLPVCLPAMHDAHLPGYGWEIVRSEVETGLSLIVLPSDACAADVQHKQHALDPNGCLVQRGHFWAGHCRWWLAHLRYQPYCPSTELAIALYRSPFSRNSVTRIVLPTCRGQSQSMPVSQSL